MWPFGKHIEHRESATDAIVSALISQAGRLKCSATGRGSRRGRGGGGPMGLERSHLHRFSLRHPQR